MASSAAAIVDVARFEWARQADPAHDLGTVIAELLPFDGEALRAIEIAIGMQDANARFHGEIRLSPADA